MSEDFSSLLTEAPSFLKPKLKLFLSVDIVGSTAYKQTSRAQKSENPPIETWVSMVTHFYQEFPTQFLTERGKLEKKYQTIEGWIKTEEPSLWKAAGDELIYTITLTDYRQSALFMTAWVEAVKNVRKMLEKYSNKLTLKATGWLAGFPVANSEVYLGLGYIEGSIGNESDAGSHIDAAGQNMLRLNRLYKEDNVNNGSASSFDKRFVDYIGPSLDIGFRLASYATPRQFVCSVELAWLVCKAFESDEVRKMPDIAANCVDNNYPFHISGRHAMKGVLDGVPYPIIWIDTGEHIEFNKIEDEIFNNQPIGKRDLINYSEKFINSCNVDYLFLPFIWGNIGSTKERYNSKYKTLLDHWKQMTKDHEAAVAIPPITLAPNPKVNTVNQELFNLFLKAIDDKKKPS